MSYCLTYEITPHPEGIEKDQVPEGEGACDAIIVVSILHGDAATSRMFIGIDGRESRVLNPGEMFASWAVWASQLADMLSLDSWQWRAVRDASEAVKTAVLKSQEFQG